MKEFKNLRIEIWRTACGDGPLTRSQNYITIRADLPRPMVQKRLYMRNDPTDETEMEEDYSYLGYIHFLWTEEEFKTFASGNWHTFNDGMHRADSCGDSVIFYDDIRSVLSSRNRTSNDKVEHAFFNATIPIFFRRFLQKVARKIWRGLEKAQHQAVEESRTERYGHLETSDREWARNFDQVRLQFSKGQCERFVRLYGQGKGPVDVELSTYNPEIIAEQLRKDSEDAEFVRRFEHIQQIARNSTWGFHQRAKVLLSLDDKIRPGEKSPGYYWRALNCRGQQVMNGALLDSRRSLAEPPRWSTHT